MEQLLEAAVEGVLLRGALLALILLRPLGAQPAVGAVEHSTMLVAREALLVRVRVRVRVRDRVRLRVRVEPLTL